MLVQEGKPCSPINQHACNNCVCTSDLEVESWTDISKKRTWLRTPLITRPIFFIDPISYNNNNDKLNSSFELKLYILGHEKTTEPVKQFYLHCGRISNYKSGLPHHPLLIIIVAL